MVTFAGFFDADLPSGRALAALTPVLLLVVAFVGYCLLDLIRAPRVQYLPKPVWALLILLSSPPFGAIGYRHPTLTQRWTARLAILSTGRCPADPPPRGHDDLVAAATYRETIALTAALLSRSAHPGTIDPLEHTAADLSTLLIGPPSMAKPPTNRDLGAWRVIREREGGRCWGLLGLMTFGSRTRIVGCFP